MRHRLNALVLLSACFVSSGCLAATFQGQGTLEGGGNMAYAISADGSTVVGISFPVTSPPPPNDVDGAFRWTSDSGLQLLGPGADGIAFAVSADGSTIVGDRFLWRASEGVQALYFDEVKGISANGTIVVGSTDNGPGSQPIFWTAADGVSILPGLPSAPHLGSALVISVRHYREAHGTTAAGQSAARPSKSLAAVRHHSGVDLGTG